MRDEHAAPSLENGAVWITYQPDLDQKKIGKLRDLAQNDSLVLASPYPDQDSSMVATARVNSWPWRALRTQTSNGSSERSARGRRPLILGWVLAALVG